MRMADGFGKIYYTLGNQFDIRKKVLFKADEKGISRNGEYLLKDKSGKEPGKRVGAFTAERLIESVMKDRRDKFRDIEIFLKELKKEGVSSMKVS